MEKKSKINSNKNLPTVERKIDPIYNPLMNKVKRNSIANLEIFLSGYKIISAQNVIAILSKNKKLRMDIENRWVADYLSKKYKYFKDIKKETKLGYLKLIAALKFKTIQANEIIINIGDENNNLYIIYEGSIIVYKESKHRVNKSLSEIRDYLRALYNEDKVKYNYITKKNSNLELNFDNIIKDDYKIQAKDKTYNFYYEILEDMGTFSDGFSFGEKELIKKTNREIIIKTVTDCKLIYINKFDYNRILRTPEEKALEKKANNFIKHFPLFKDWTMEQLVKLFNYLVTEIKYKDDFIYKQNEQNEYLYFLEDGAVIQYCNISFSWYKEYIDYIKDFNNNLLDILLKLKYKKTNTISMDEINKYLINTIKEIKDVYNKRDYKDKYPFLNIDKIYLQRKKDLIEMSELYNHENNVNNFFKIKYEENDLNEKETLYKIPIYSTKVATIFGLEEIFELKNKVTSVGCISDQVNLKKIKIIDFLNILYSNKDYDYIETFLEIMIQKKLILCNTIKTQTTKCGLEFEKLMNNKYEKLITQQNIITVKDDQSIIVDEKLQDEAIVSLRLKGWNNGLYLDNILDSNLYLIKPKTKKQIKKEEVKKCNTLNYLYNIKTFTNEKILHSTKYSFDKLFNKNQIQFLKSFKGNKKIKNKVVLDLKSISFKYKHNKTIKKLFKTNIPLDNEQIIFDKIKKKYNKEKKSEKIIISKTVSESPLSNINQRKKRVYKKMINYKVSEESKDEKNKQKLNNENNYGYSHLNSGSIWTRSKDFDYLPSIV